MTNTLNTTELTIKIAIDTDTNTHTLSDIFDTLYAQVVNKDYLENKYSNINLKDNEGHAIGNFKIVNNKQEVM